MARKMTRDNARAFYAVLAKNGPSPQTELYYTNPYTLVVAVALSAQATDVGVNKATAKLFPVADTPKKMVALGEDKVADYIKTIGLWRNKAKNVVALSKMLLDDFGGQVPADRDQLEKLPGVGRKTANVVCNVAFGQPTIAVDTHIFRIGNRTGIAPGKSPLEVEKGLEKITPEEYLMDAHHWLILHGRYVCKARTPECYRCSVSEFCLYKDKTPAAGVKPASALKKTDKKKKTSSKKTSSKTTAKKTKKTTIKMANKPKLKPTSKPNGAKK